jgi:hypothetical protein
MKNETPNKYSYSVSHFLSPQIRLLLALEDKYANWYQQLTGTLWWAVELGRIDIHLNVPLLAQYLAQPRVGHLKQAFHIFAYLKTHPILVLYFHATCRRIPVYQ